MNELEDYMNNLINEIDNSDLVKSLLSIQDKIYSDIALMNLLKEYKYKPNDELKEKILLNSLFQEYKHKETDLNLFIMELNKRLNSIKEKESCKNENN